MAKKKSASDLKALLAAERSDALAAMQASKLSGERSDAMLYYLGDMSKDMPAQDGRSRAVSTDVADTVEGLMPSLMEIFCGTDEVVRFEAVGPEDEKAAEQETDYVNHVFMQRNEGFITLYSFIKDCLLQKVGIVKVIPEEREKEERETYFDQSEDQFAIITQEVLASDGKLTITEHTVNEGEEPGPDGSMVKVATHDVTVVAVSTKRDIKVYGVPPEEFGIERGARDIKNCNYLFHEPPTTVGSLIEQGYDPAQVRKLATASRLESEQIARDTVDEQSPEANSLNDLARPVKLTEHHIRLDMEGNGRACLYRIATGGDQGEILRRKSGEDKSYEDDIEKEDEYPFAAVTPVPIPHRFFGRSIADLVMDIQRIKTALLRGGLDNIYLHVNPRVEIAESHAGVNTIDDLLVSRPGGLVRTKQPGGLQWQVVPDITGSVWPAMEYMDQTRENRTGVARQGQALDANALQNETATKANLVFTAVQARMKLIARIIAETGVRDMFSLLHATLRKHGGKGQTVRLRNQWVTVNPRQWKTREDLTINVGLGDGGKAQQMAMGTMIAGFQEKLVLAGKTNLVDDQKLYNSASMLAKLAGHKNPDLFFNNPSETDEQGQPKYPAPPPQPDPAMAKIQADAQIKSAELQQRGQELQAKAAIDQQADQRKADIESVQAQADIATQERKMQADAALAQQKFEFDRELALINAALEREKFEREEARKDREHAQNMELQRQQHQERTAEGEKNGGDMSAFLSKIDQRLDKIENKKPTMTKVVRDREGRAETFIQS